MNEFLRVRNLPKYQHYKDRNPPWIKLHRDLLEDYDFESLPDATKAHALLLLLLAARLDNRIPADSEWIARKIGARSPVDTESLIRSRFLERIESASVHGASSPLAESKQSALIEGEAEERERRDRGRGEAKARAATNGSTPKASPPEGSLIEEFDKLWNAYGKKVNKPKAIKAYKSAKKRGCPPIDELIRIVGSWNGTKKWTEQGRKYQPYLASWLNGDGWGDDLPQSDGGDRRAMGSTPDRVSAFASVGEAIELPGARA